MSINDATRAERGLDDLPSVRVQVGRTRTERFLKGPLAWPWLAKAGALRGRTMQVALALCLRSGLEGTACVKLPLNELAQMNIDRHAANRALLQLEHAGLVSVVRSKGKKALVTLLGHTPPPSTNVTQPRLFSIPRTLK